MISKIKFMGMLELGCTEIDVRIEPKQAPSPGRTIDWEPVTTYQELTISAEIRRREAIGKPWRDECFGQCRDALQRFAQGARIAHQKIGRAAITLEQCDALEELIVLWKRWHLNGMRAGLRGQMDALRAQAEREPGVYEFSRACQYLEIAGLQPHPLMGYHYGSAWLVELLPEEVVARLRALCKTLGGRVLEAA